MMTNALKRGGLKVWYKFLKAPTHIKHIQHGKHNKYHNGYNLNIKCTSCI